jgi:hypothetical protein
MMSGVDGVDGVDCELLLVSRVDESVVVLSKLLLQDGDYMCCLPVAVRMREGEGTV